MGSIPVNLELRPNDARDLLVNGITQFDGYSKDVTFSIALNP